VIATNVFQEFEFPSMSQGRVALVGDAAHSMTSFFGQGACSAIEDAAVLGNLFGENRSSLDNADQLLVSYASERAERTRDMARFSMIFAGVHMARLPLGLGPPLRWLLYTLVPSWFWLWYLSWIYGFQPTVSALPAPSPSGKEASAREG
jgi:salicylate hydroxylase